MKSYRCAAGLAVALAALALAPAQAQWRGRFSQNFEITDPQKIKEQEMMEKALNPEFHEDVFTFARLKFQAERGRRFGGGRGWHDDTPEADLNLIFRLYQVTSLKVRPGLHFINITTKDLINYPFVYLASAGTAAFMDEEADALRQYLLAGGFMMADDFWGDDQWAHFCHQMKRVFPQIEPVELTLEHRIFHTVFDFKKQPQIPSVGAYFQTGQSYDPASYYQRDHDPHYYALYDERQRMMVLICHNNHYGDGWEHEGDDESYFDRFSEPMAYPMLINILVYTMAH